MGNCLITKLKDVVSNDNLLKLGVVEFVNLHKESPTSNETYHLFKAPNATLSKMKTETSGVEGAGLSYASGTSSGNQYNMDIIRLYDKYNYTELKTGAGFLISNIESLKNCISITTFDVHSAVVPDYIAGTMTSLTKVEQNSPLSGDEEKLAEVARENGRTNGYIYRPWNMGQLKIGGWRIASNVQTCVIHWDGDFEWAANGYMSSGYFPTRIWTNEKTSAARIAEWNAQGATVYVYKNGSLVDTYNPTNQ